MKHTKYTTFDISRIILSSSHGSVKDINSPKFKLLYDFEINTKFLNPANDKISVILLKKSHKSSWILTDNGCTDEGCDNLGSADLFDKNIKSFLRVRNNARTQFQNSIIHYGYNGFYLKFDDITKLESKLRQLLQFIIETHANARLIRCERNLNKN